MSDEEYEQQQYLGERNAWDRVGAPNARIEMGLDVSDLPQNIKYDIVSPEMRFTQNVSLVGNEIISKSGDYFTNGDLERVIDKISSTDKVKYKNPTVFILGYIATNGGKDTIDKKRLFRTREILDNLSENMRKGIEMEDVVRYARLWKIHLK